LNKQYVVKANELILLQEKGRKIDELMDEIEVINEVCDHIRKWVFEQSSVLMNRGKKVILLGGDHSTPLGYMQALAQKYDSFGILQIDAHADLRQAYEGFEFSHASIMFNALKMAQLTSLVQVGVRDICQEEIDLVQADKRIRTYFDIKLHQERFRGVSVSEQWDRVINDLPERVYVSIDIDGLDPKLCPNTGTPVPGGLQYAEVVELFRRLKDSGKEIIGCDLNEVGNQEWDANVGARILYELSCIL
jgi:agmatinase